VLDFGVGTTAPQLLHQFRDGPRGCPEKREVRHEKKLRCGLICSPLAMLGRVRRTGFVRLLRKIHVCLRLRPETRACRWLNRVSRKYVLNSLHVKIWSVALCRLTLPLDRLCGFVGACILHIVVTLHFSETVRVLDASVSVQHAASDSRSCRFTFESWKPGLST
jgi:hypothetical protein